MWVFREVGMAIPMGVVGLWLECKEWTCCRYTRNKELTDWGSSRFTNRSQIISSILCFSCWNLTWFLLLLSPPMIPLCLRPRFLTALPHHTTGSIVFAQMLQGPRPSLPGFLCTACTSKLRTAVIFNCHMLSMPPSLSHPTLPPSYSDLVIWHSSFYSNISSS